MKSIFLIITISFLFIVNANSNYEKSYTINTLNIPSSINDKVFIKEYTYNASDDDSKNSSRKIAIAELKSLLSEEIGVHIESSFDIEKTSSSKIVKKEIHQLSASITKLKILEEKWNGITYYIKASVKVNEEQTMLLLLEAIKAKASKKDLNKLTKILKKKNYKINELNKQITLQEFLNKKHNEYKNQLDLNLGFLMNIKYLCIKQGIILNNKITQNEDFNYKIKFYIDHNIILHTEQGLILTNTAPQIYENEDIKITLTPVSSNRYLIIDNKKESNDTILLKCKETKIWNTN